MAFASALRLRPGRARTTGGRRRGRGGQPAGDRTERRHADHLQIIYLSVRESTTEVVTFVKVPGGTEDFGMLLPIPAVPTINPGSAPSGDGRIVSQS